MPDFQPKKILIFHHNFAHLSLFRLFFVADCYKKKKKKKKKKMKKSGGGTEKYPGLLKFAKVSTRIKKLLAYFNEAIFY